MDEDADEDADLDATGLGDKLSVRENLEIEKVGKLSNTKIFFTLLKGFIGTGVLFCPKAI